MYSIHKTLRYFLKYSRAQKSLERLEPKIKSICFYGLSPGAGSEKTLTVVPGYHTTAAKPLLRQSYQVVFRSTGT